jgi:hypothetical protein
VVVVPSGGPEGLREKRRSGSARPGDGNWPRCDPEDRSVIAQLNESPQAQELPALGLSIVKPCFSMVSAKSIVAPSR